MSSKYKYKEIKEIIEYTPSELKGKQINKIAKSYYVGYYMHACANWAYQVYIIEHNGYLRPVVVVFGEIK